MQEKYGALLFTILFYTIAILGIGLVIAFIIGAYIGLMSGTDIFQAPQFFRALSNVLFFTGAIVFTFGAFVEFFVKASSPSIARAMMLPHEVFSRRFALEEKDKDAARTDEYAPGGWMLIAIGAIIIIISAAFAYVSMK